MERSITVVILQYTAPQHSLCMNLERISWIAKMWTENVSVSTWHSLFISSASSICHRLRLFEKRHNIATRLTGSRWFRKTGWLGRSPLINHQASVRDIPAVNIRWFNITLPSLSAIRLGRNTQILTLWPPIPVWAIDEEVITPQHRLNIFDTSEGS